MVLVLGVVVTGAVAVIALALMGRTVQRINRCPACLCELGACRGHGDVLFCPLCRAQGAMVTRRPAGPPPPPPASKDPGSGVPW